MSRSPVRRHHVSATLVAGVLAVAPSATAVAQGCQGAPGASALEQYCEAIPRADGGRDRPNSGQGSGEVKSAGVSSKTAAALQAEGRDGAAVSQLAGGASSGGSGDQKSAAGGRDRSGGSSSASGGSTSGAAGGGLAAAATVSGPSDPSPSPLKAATKAVGSGPTAGEGLVWGLVGLSAIGAVGAVIVRRRSLTPPGADDAS